MNNIVLFRGRASASKFSALQILPAVVGTPRSDRAVIVQRPRMIAIWHINPRSGKLECFWTTERGGAPDEDGSRRAA